ncbi:MAG TPA: hypothetical protein VFX49_05860 [Chloroflexota bacterium]|nr:hypothetical protein [Chloroflexota bacterium]
MASPLPLPDTSPGSTPRRLADIDAALLVLQAEAVRIRDAMLRVTDTPPDAEITGATRAAVAAAGRDVERLSAQLETLRQALLDLSGAPSDAPSDASSDAPSGLSAGGP